MAGYVIWPYDCVDTMLHILDEKSVHCAVTSPPYFGLRDYKHAGQIGLEQSPDEYVAKMVSVCRAIWRVLRDDGTLWLNIGDSYAGSWGNAAGHNRGNGTQREITVGSAIKDQAVRNGDFVPPGKYGFPDIGVKEKDLMGIPWRVALALQADGWYLRNDIIWSKPNPMPESTRDRFTKSHEHVFLFAKQPRYFFDQEAVKEPSIYAPGATAEVERPKGHYKGKWAVAGGGGRNDSSFKAIRTLRNKRDVWVIPTRPFGGAHFAAFPPALAEPCILAGSPPSCCAACGAPRVGRYERTETEDSSYKGSTFDKGKTRARDGGDRTQEGPRMVRRHVGYFPSCECAAPDAPATVLDPFGGTGTTAMVAIKHGRRAVLCEINPDYVETAHKRIAGGK